MYTGTNKFKKGYKSRTNLLKDEEGELLADSHKILDRWKNYFCQLLNVHGSGNLTQTEMHIAKPFVPQPSVSEIDIPIGKLKRYKSPSVYQIPAKLNQAGRETFILRSISFQV
jgi:hypothetical protein